MTDCRAFVVAYRDVLTDGLAFTYQAWCRSCEWEGDPTANDTVAQMQMQRHREQQEGQGNE